MAIGTVHCGQHRELDAAVGSVRQSVRKRIAGAPDVSERGEYQCLASIRRDSHVDDAGKAVDFNDPAVAPGQI